MKGLLTLLATAALAGSSAYAADLGMEPATPLPMPAASWAVLVGIAFDGYHYGDSGNDEGPNNSDWNFGGHVDFSAAHLGPGGWGAQFDVRGSLFDDSHDGDGDWTSSYLTGAVHLLAQRPAGLLAAFAGGGVTDDTGDTDDPETYWFAGVQGARPLGPVTVFGDIGYLNGNDEYDEGINQAGFGRIGARYFAQSNMAFMAALSGAFGQQDNGDEASSDALIGDVKLEAEYGFGAHSLFASYEGTFVSFDGGEHQADFHAAMVGLRWRPGSSDLASGYNTGVALDVAPVDRWFAYTANEVE